MFKKAIAILGSLAVIGIGAASGQTAGQANTPSQVKKRTEARKTVETRTARRAGFVDENGDGINDLFRDYDGDGIPNCQDPDWVRPQDGTGYKGGNGPRGSFGNRAGSSGAGRGLNKGSFRQGRGGFGSGVCDGTGPKGNARRGRGR